MICYCPVVRYYALSAMFLLLWRFRKLEQNRNHFQASLLASASTMIILVLLNKLRYHPTSNFQPIRLLDLDYCYKFTYLMANSADPDQLPTDLDLHCLQRQGISGFSRTRVKSLHLAPFLKHKQMASRLMKLHTHIHYDAPCLLQSTVTDLDLLFIFGWTMFSLCL